MSEHSAEKDGTSIVGKKKGNDKTISPRGTELPTGIHTVLYVLFQGQQYAKTLRRDIWDFALELPNLCGAGLSINDLRWLACMGYVNHAEEINSPHKGRRSFRAYPRLTFTQRTCFVLTPQGAQLARELLNVDALKFKDTESGRSVNIRIGSEPPFTEFVRNGSSLADAPYRFFPHWDRDRRELRIGGELIKQFKLPSPNQETILIAFEEDGWPTRIDDPLPPVYSLSPKRRLHDTIKSLNRRQKSRRLRFMGDGRGEGVIWEPMELP